MEENMKIEYRKLTDNESAPWLLLTNIDELIWNGVYVLRVTGDDGSSGLPFRLGNDDTVTLVLKDHAHEGALQSGRTIVQTVTYVERATGKVFTYTRTRCKTGKSHSWSYWTLAEEGSGITEIPKASSASLGAVIVGEGLSVDGDGKISVASDSVNEETLSRGLRDRIDTIEEMSKLAEALVVNDGITISFGALIENSEPYVGTQYATISNKILANGETIVVNSGYKITSYKMFDGEQEILFIKNMADDRFQLNDIGYCYQFEFTKDQSTAFRKEELQKVVKSFIRNVFVWNNESHIDKFTTHGTYNIKGFRGNLADGLPIYNTGTIEARLTVFAADNCITQVLTLLNTGGGDSNIYVRTKQADKWGMWGKLQSNVEVGAIGLGQGRTFDDLTDNGIYSGANVYSVGTGENGYPITAYENFVLITINAYLTGGGISQLKYSLLSDGTTTVATRAKHDNVWGEWSSINKVDSEINNESENPVQNKTIAKALSEAVEQGRQLALRSLFVAAGAVYNENTGFYSLNGVSDLTENDIMLSYINKDAIYRLNIPRVLQGSSIRTIYPYVGHKNLGDVFMNTPLSGYCTFASAKLEILKFAKSSYSSMDSIISAEMPLAANVKWDSTFLNCTSLREIWPIDVRKVPSFSVTVFKGCSSLAELRLLGVSNSLHLGDSVDIRKTSIIYIVSNSRPTSAITITLHPDAYARLADDAEIIAALEAQPLVSLVSA